MDRAFLFGDAVYEVLPVFAGRLFALEAHLERLETGGAIDQTLSIDLILTDLTTGTSRAVPAFATTFIWGKEGDFTQWAGWSPDGAATCRFVRPSLSIR